MRVDKSHRRECQKRTESVRREKDLLSEQLEIVLLGSELSLSMIELLYRDLSLLICPQPNKNGCGRQSYEPHQS